MTDRVLLILGALAVGVTVWASILTLLETLE